MELLKRFIFFEMYEEHEDGSLESILEMLQEMTEKMYYGDKELSSFVEFSVGDTEESLKSGYRDIRRKFSFVAADGKFSMALIYELMQLENGVYVAAFFEIGENQEEFYERTLEDSESRTISDSDSSEVTKLGEVITKNFFWRLRFEVDKFKITEMGLFESLAKEAAELLSSYGFKDINIRQKDNNEDRLYVQFRDKENRIGNIGFDFYNNYRSFGDYGIRVDIYASYRFMEKEFVYDNTFKAENVLEFIEGEINKPKKV